ncbi:MAG: nicotinate (nicotinamide) nucleotide adenylyltransferase [Luteolibacter sp.]
MPEPKKIALFGGTFDPVHLGHLHLATRAKAALDLDQVRFLPCRISPHKADSQPASGEDRCAMLRLATAPLPWAAVDDFELHQSSPSYSFQTAEAMARRFPTARLFWIMGGDQWDVLPTWKSPERLAALVEFIVLTRGESPKPHPGFRLHAMPDEGHPASATRIRERIKNGESADAWLNASVADWIHRHGLYQP